MPSSSGCAWHSRHQLHQNPKTTGWGECGGARPRPGVWAVQASKVESSSCSFNKLYTICTIVRANNISKKFPSSADLYLEEIFTSFLMLINIIQIKIVCWRNGAFLSLRWIHWYLNIFILTHRKRCNISLGETAENRNPETCYLFNLILLNINVYLFWCALIIHFIFDLIYVPSWGRPKVTGYLQSPHKKNDMTMIF